MTPHLLWVLNYDILREQKKFRKPSVFQGCIFEMQGREKKEKQSQIHKDNKGFISCTVCGHRRFNI